MKLRLKKGLSISLFKIALFLLPGLIAQTSFAQDFMGHGDFVRGSKVWAETCSRCHNMRNAAELRDDQWVTSVFHMRVRAGLTGQETRDVLTYLQASNVKIKVKEPASSRAMVSDTANVVVASGQVIYENNCTGCHGADGKGNVPGVPDFTKKRGVLNKPDKELLSNITNGYKSSGSVLFMPPKGGNSELTPADVSSVFDYIKDAFSH